MEHDDVLDLLIEKLSWYGIDTTVTNWIKNYLQLRRMRVVINGEKSGEADGDVGSTIRVGAWPTALFDVC